MLCTGFMCPTPNQYRFLLYYFVQEEKMSTNKTAVIHNPKYQRTGKFSLDKWDKKPCNSYR